MMTIHRESQRLIRIVTLNIGNVKVITGHTRVENFVEKNNIYLFLST